MKVLHSEREEFEKQQGWTIKKMYSQEQSPVEASPVEEEYAPVIFAQDAYKHVVSFDMLTGKVKTLFNPVYLVSLRQCMQLCLRLWNSFGPTRTMLELTKPFVSLIETLSSLNRETIGRHLP